MEKKQFYLAGHLSNWLVVAGSAKSGINRSTTPTDPYGPPPVHLFELLLQADLLGKLPGMESDGGTIF